MTITLPLLALLAPFAAAPAPAATLEAPPAITMPVRARTRRPVTLPTRIPIPVPRPASEAPAETPGETPPVTPVAPEVAKPAPKPAPQSAPESESPAPPSPTPPDEKTGEQAPGEEVRDVIAEEDPVALEACLADLTALGARFEQTAPIDEGEGCGMRKPVTVTEILPGISLGGAVLRCETALRLGQWLKKSVTPALDVARPGRKIVSLTPGTTFACRLRNNAATGKLSEHARGNGFDVAGFRLDDGETIEMVNREKDHTITGAFQSAVSAGACLFFTTVLAPGSDAAHETHLHLDVKPREKGYRICDFP